MDGVFVAYLFDVNKNLATVGIGGSKCDRMWSDSPGDDIRVPTVVPAVAASSMIEGLDRGLPPISSWRQLYQWFGRGNGWAYFTAETAKEFVPHWFIGVEYKCRQNKANGYFSGPFFDLDTFASGRVSLNAVDEMTGPNAEGGEPQRLFEQFGDNFVITRRPIFMI